MPTYDYECRQCGHRFERFQPMTAEPVKACPKCKGRVARLLSGGSGIIFKGSGFYHTDYKKNSAPTAPDKSRGKPADSGRTGPAE
ncbi:MAG: zinc ribbon domain-containing protein [Kiritimatiellae bacterium]|jgi:putative FmdB family regulatory protein|nr:zinc ribbon domain-containing protein [Kiritimatiellia bacterium]NLD89653.1 zinc ribbon domain-containing protein [Lentisphaerota bacterium]HOU22346.1 zinc ribbon domain-containing protein [Kiritimatiellia bacterium]HPC19179.1 zinc ribbon domain-containing protein [Kiritimatiellia bacterium]HQN80838.1 zinc ribbon domain-containing protein [Kiritimatiellia bacterium]